MIAEFKGRKPDIADDVFIAPDATVIGEVNLAAQVSVFFGSVLRGDILAINVGRGSNIQEHSMLHTSRGRNPLYIGEMTTIGHRATIHGARVGSNCLIGMGAILLDDALIEDECLVGAGTLVPEGKTFPPRSLIIGSPGKAVRTLSEADLKAIRQNAEHYIALGAWYRENL
ncbi:MAG: gamma carbonic anhydrase family protein [bacterium]|nr:gamma carbonic anhydrase family protein [bacterium]